jgi:hypothetical protein
MTTTELLKLGEEAGIEAPLAQELHDRKRRKTFIKRIASSSSLQLRGEGTFSAAVAAGRLHHRSGDTGFNDDDFFDAAEEERRRSLRASQAGRQHAVSVEVAEGERLVDDDETTNARRYSSEDGKAQATEAQKKEGKQGKKGKKGKKGK